MLWKKDGQLKSNTTNIFLPKNIVIFSELNAALKNAKEILIAVPSDNLREILIKMKSLNKNFDIWWASKGFEVNTGLLPHNICEEILKEKYCDEEYKQRRATELAD